jgi:hypothetical protein
MPFASIGLGLGLDELQNKGYAGSSHPLEYVPCPAHNKAFAAERKKRAPAEKQRSKPYEY